MLAIMAGGFVVAGLAALALLAALGRNRRRLRSLLAVAATVATLGATMMLTVPSGAANNQERANRVPTHSGHAVEAMAQTRVRPAVFDGDVRDLPPDPSWAHTELEPGNPPDRKPSRSSGTFTPTRSVQPNMPATGVSFEGLFKNQACTGGTCGAGNPPDTNGDVGPLHYIEGVNTAVGIFDKAGAPQAAFTFNSLWAAANTSTPCDNLHFGDPTIQFDPLHNRWIVADFAFAFTVNPVPPYYECIAVSRTADPVTGGWYLYAIQADTGPFPPGALPDYPKMGIWPTGLFMTTNEFQAPTFNFIGVGLWAFNLDDLISGAALRSVVTFIANPNDPFSVLPANVEGSTPPAGRPEFLVSESQTVFAFEVRTFAVDWTTSPPSGTVSAATNVSQTPYTVPGQNIVPQVSAATLLDSLGDRLMNQTQYQNLGGNESLWVSHTFRTTSGGPTGIQWAQIGVPGGAINTTPVQQQLYAPGDGLYRWMPSLALDSVGNMALGFSTSSAAAFPSIAWAGRLVGDAPNTLGQGEAVMTAGMGSQLNSSRWGDYSEMTLDPDGCRLWYTNEYYPDAGTGSARLWHTRVASFQYPSCTARTTDVSVSLTHSPEPQIIGKAVTYQVTVTNPAGLDATGVSVTDVLDPSLTFVSYSSPGFTCTHPAQMSTGTLVCTRTSLASGASDTIDITVRTHASGSIPNQVDLSVSNEASFANNSASSALQVNVNGKGCTLFGSAGPDTLNGTAGDDVICTVGGADIVNGMGGNDKVFAGDGADQVTDTSGTDLLVGNAGNDQLDAQDTVGGDVLKGAVGTDTCTADPGDTVTSC